MTTRRKLPPCEVARLLGICKRLNVPMPRHVRDSNGKYVLWVDGRDFLFVLQRLAESWGVHGQ